MSQEESLKEPPPGEVRTTVGGSSTGATEPLLSHQLSSIPPETPVKQDVPDVKPSSAVKAWIVGDFNWLYFLLPLSLYAKNRRGHGFMRLRGDGEFIPLVLNIFLGIQNASVAVGYIATSPILLTLTYPDVFGEYALHAAVIVAGICSLVQCIQIKIPRTPYQIGSGLCAFLGASTVMTSVFIGLIGRVAVDNDISQSDAFGKVLGTAAVCSLFFIALSLIPRKYAKVLFPPIVSGIIIVLIGIEVVGTSTKEWGGGPLCQALEGPCYSDGNVHLPFGSPEYLGLGLFVAVLFLVIELFGSAFIRHIVILVATMIVYGVSAIVRKDGHRYVTGDVIDETEDISFLWTDTFNLSFDKSAVMPLIGAYLVTYLQATAILTATVEESEMNVTDEEKDSRIQGGLITTGIASLFAVLATGLPVTPIPQNNSAIYISRIASRYAGISGAVWLLIYGILGKVMAFFVLEIPSAVRGGIFTLVSATVILSGVKVLSRGVKWDRRSCIILFFAFSFGLGNIVLGNFITTNLWPLGPDPRGFEESLQYAVISAMEVPYFMGGITAIILHLILPKDMELGYIDTLPETRT